MSFTNCFLPLFLSVTKASSLDIPDTEAGNASLECRRYAFVSPRFVGVVDELKLKALFAISTQISLDT